MSDPSDDADWRSALFIDTFSRSLRLSPLKAAVTWWSKAALLLLNVPLVWVITGGHTDPCPRQWPVMLCTGSFVARVLVQMAVFWSRSIPWKEVWLEAGGIIPLSVASLALGAARRPRASGWSLGGALMLFYGGTWLNVWPEYQRHRWKQEQGHEGRLYTGGLWSFVRHINYTGEMLSFFGYSWVTGAVWTLWVPTVMSLGLATVSVREIEFYLARKYGEEWKEYVSRVRHVMLPGLW